MCSSDLTIEDMALTFTEDAPWSPIAYTHTVQAKLQLPFGFGLSINQIMNGFNITQNGTVIAGLQTVRTRFFLSSSLWQSPASLLFSSFFLFALADGFLT